MSLRNQLLILNDPFPPNCGARTAVNDDTLRFNGNLTKKRLDRSLNHIPIKHKAKHAIHRWLVFGKEGDSLLYCMAYKGCSLSYITTTFTE